MLTDFGLSSIADLADHNNSHHVGSPGYEAPETLSEPPEYTTKCDVWSLGVILYSTCCHQCHPSAQTHHHCSDACDASYSHAVLVSGCPPFHGDTAHRHRSILQGKYDFPADYFRSVSSDAKVRHAASPPGMLLHRACLYSRCLSHTHFDFVSMTVLPATQDLIGWCLQVAPESRASMDDILSHQWLQSASKSAHLAARKEIGKYADKALFRTTLSAAAKQTNNLKSTRTLLVRVCTCLSPPVPWVFCLPMDASCLPCPLRCLAYRCN